MGVPDSRLAFRQSLSPSQITDLRLAASKMTGPKRRAFEAEMTLKYCGGNPLRAETLFGWGRQTVALGHLIDGRERHLLRVLDDIFGDAPL